MWPSSVLMTYKESQRINIWSIDAIFLGGRGICWTSSTWPVAWCKAVVLTLSCQCEQSWRHLIKLCSKFFRADKHISEWNNLISQFWHWESRTNDKTRPTEAITQKQETAHAVHGTMKLSKQSRELVLGAVAYCLFYFNRFLTSVSYSKFILTT